MAKPPIIMPSIDVQRIGLQHAAVHERAGIAFVGVADEVAGLVGGLGGHGPFLAGGKSAAAAAAELRLRDFVDDPLRIALLEHFGQGLEAAVVEILFHALGIDHAVVPQGHAALAIEEGHVAVELEELPADRLALAPPGARPAWPPRRCSRTISSRSASFSMR